MIYIRQTIRNVVFHLPANIKSRIDPNIDRNMAVVVVQRLIEFRVSAVDLHLKFVGRWNVLFRVRYENHPKFSLRTQNDNMFSQKRVNLQFFQQVKDCQYRNWLFCSPPNCIEYPSCRPSLRTFCSKPRPGKSCPKWFRKSLHPDWTRLYRIRC